MSRRRDAREGRTQAWTKDMPEGSHRLKAKWLEHRYDWLQADGRPLLPGWKRMKQAKRIRDMEDNEFCAAQNERIALSSLEEDFPANEGPDLEEWGLMEEADWTPMEEEASFELSAAYQERKAIEEAIRLQVPPCKVRIMEEVDALMSSKGPEREANPKAKESSTAMLVEGGGGGNGGKGSHIDVEPSDSDELEAVEALCRSGEG